jgi:hypothetical protein
VTRAGVARWYSPGRSGRTYGCIVDDGGQPMWSFAYCGPRNKVSLRVYDVVPTRREVPPFLGWYAPWTRHRLQRGQSATLCGSSRGRDSTRVPRVMYGSITPVVPVPFDVAVHSTDQSHFARPFKSVSPARDIRRTSPGCGTGIVVDVVRPTEVVDTTFPPRGETTMLILEAGCICRGTGRCPVYGGGNSDSWSGVSGGGNSRRMR